jgi:hypothetical protein
MRKPVKTATFNGRRYDFELIGRLDGCCDQYSDRGRVIMIMSPPNTRIELETIIHEGLHAGNWVASEDNVTQAAEDITRLLWRLGYRRN